MQGTAYIARRPDAPAWAMRPAAVMATVNPAAAAAIPTQRLTTPGDGRLLVARPVGGAAGGGPGLAIVTLHFSH